MSSTGTLTSPINKRGSSTIQRPFSAGLDSGLGATIDSKKMIFTGSETESQMIMEKAHMSRIMARIKRPGTAIDKSLNKQR